VKGIPKPNGNFPIDMQVAGDGQTGGFEATQSYKDYHPQAS
jgi:hypothetical protein